MPSATMPAEKPRVFSVDCRDKDGDLYSLKVEAPSEEHARAKALQQGHVVEGASKGWTGQTATPAAVAFRSGQSLAEAGFVLGIAGLVIPGLCIAALITGAAARELSQGKFGRGAMRLGAFGIIVTILFTLVMVLIVKSEMDAARAASMFRAIR